MELADLNEKERIALVVLMRLCVPADAQAADAEAERSELLNETFGEVEVGMANLRADDIQDEPGLRAALAEVRTETRDVIYAFVREMVLEGGVHGREAAVLALVEKEWGLT